MNRAIAALPVVLGVMAANVDLPLTSDTFGVSETEALIIEATPISWPESEPLSPEPHTVFGTPTYERHDDRHNSARKYSGFTVYYDDEVLAPRWTAIKLTAEMADRNSDFDRPSRFKKDPRLSDDGFATTSHDDYKNPSGSRKWARGHIVQFDDARGWGDQSGKDSFFTSNIAPQLQDHNGKGWLALEKACTEFARDYGVVWIYSGPIYGSRPRPFATGRKVPRPKAFYKIAVSPGEGGSVDVLAFRMPHKEIASDVDLSKFLVSIDEIESETGIDFLSELPDAVEGPLEAAVWELWPDLPDE